MNEIENMINEFKKPKVLYKNEIDESMILIGDSEERLKDLPECSIDLVFTSPPYYNAREYSQ